MDNNNIQAYDAGSIDVDSSGVTIIPEMDIQELLIYPTVDATVSLNNSTTKEIFCPKEMWTPVSISRNFLCTNFVVKSEEAGKIHWQGWVG